MYSLQNNSNSAVCRLSVSMRVHAPVCIEYCGTVFKSSPAPWEMGCQENSHVRRGPKGKANNESEREANRPERTNLIYRCPIVLQIK